MIIVKSPFRISFFGGSTDYESFYKNNGSFIIGTTIDKYVYLSIRKRPNIFSNESSIIYSKLQLVKTFDEIQNPLIRESLKYKNINFPIELTSFSDIPSRTGLGGSSSFCVGLLYIINKLLEIKQNKSDLAKDAIHIERRILNESGGIQDQIWPTYGGLNSIEINQDGIFFVKPMPVTDDFRKELEKSILLIYTNDQRQQNEIAQSHEDKDKLRILEISKESYKYFLTEDIENIGKLLFESWKEKMKISSLISNNKINNIGKIIMENGAYGIKLLGAGGCGFIMAICNPNVKNKLTELFKDSILDINFETGGVSEIYPPKT